MYRTLIVIPTYNEAENLPIITAELLVLALDELGILIVDDASPDGTGIKADQLAAENPGRMHVLHRRGKNGLGSAYVDGFRWAMDRKVDRIVQMDCDFSHSPGYVPGLVQLAEDTDLVVGSRYVVGGGIYRDRAISRNLLSWLANAVITRGLLGIQTKDATSGFRCWRRSALETIGLHRIRSKGYSFQVEMCFLAERLGLRVAETPIHFEKRRHGRSKMSIGIQVEAIWRCLQMLLQGSHSGATN